MGVAGEDQVDPAVDEHGLLQAPVFRVVTEEDLVSLLALEAVQPFCPGPEDIGVGVPDLMRIGLPVRVLFAEAPEVRQHAGGEAADQYAAGPLADPAVVQDDSAGRGQALQVGGADDPLVVAQGDIGRRQLHTALQKGEDVVLCAQQIVALERVIAQEEVPGHRDQVRTELCEALQGLGAVRIMEIGEERDPAGESRTDPPDPGSDHNCILRREKSVWAFAVPKGTDPAGFLLDH